MPRISKISCDHPGCNVSTDETRTAGALEGWTRRQITDSHKREMQEGLRDFSASVTLYFCPKHSEQCEHAASPPLHPDVRDWKNQEQPAPTLV